MEQSCRHFCMHTPKNCESFTIPDTFAQIVPFNYNEWEERIARTNIQY